MATGKTTIGKRLSSKLNLPFFDSDKEIELALGCSINEYFKTNGESKFRVIEEKIIIVVFLVGMLGWWAYSEYKIDNPDD